MNFNNPVNGKNTINRLNSVKLQLANEILFVVFF